MLRRDLPKRNEIDVFRPVQSSKSRARLLMKQPAICDAAQGIVRKSFVGSDGTGNRRHRQLACASWIESLAAHRQRIASGSGASPVNSTDRIVQPGDNVLVDLHSTYGHYYSDLSHNYIVGKPTREQEKLADAYTNAAEFLISKLVPGARIPDIWQEMMEHLASVGYVQDALAAFGHGIGIVGHEWYPAITSGEEFSNVVLQPNLTEVAALVINRPGVGGLRLECPVLVTQTGNEVRSRRLADDFGIR
jgi:hypothetical protein